MAPFLANHSSGADSYKWMLYGDDDTVFYLDNVMRMLEGLNHTMPYFITDHIWFLRSVTEGVCQAHPPFTHSHLLQLPPKGVS